MPDKDTDSQRFSELIPFYVNDTLGQNERAWMDGFIASHPEIQNEKRFVEHLAKLTQETASPIPEPERLERFLNQWREERPSSSLWQRVKAWMHGPIRMPAPVLAAVAVLVVAQSVIIGSLMTDSTQEDAFRGERADCIASPRIRVVFNPDAKHLEIVLLLRKLGMIVQEGPSETGEFWLVAPQDQQLEEAQAMLRSSPLVQEVVITRDSRPSAGCAK